MAPYASQTAILCLHPNPYKYHLKLKYLLEKLGKVSRVFLVRCVLCDISFMIKLMTNHKHSSSLAHDCLKTSIVAAVKS